VNKDNLQGFTLIELAVVLVIIGLIVGGVLVGRDLIGASYVRAQVTQIEKFNQAVNTFAGKYGALPGDMNAAVASQFGFTPRGHLGNYGGMGDGNGLIEGSANAGCNTCNSGVTQDGEPFLFWEDLTAANGLNLNLIEGSFNADITAASYPSGVQGGAINSWLPPAKIATGNDIYVWSQNGLNYFGLSVITTLNSNIYSNAGLTPPQAYNIDKKVDDGLPQSGNVIAEYLPTSYSAWAMLSFSTYGYGGPIPGAAASLNSASCYDNGGHAGVVTQYSVSNNTLNCALSFQMQGAAR
jgi:prepilin-type N-terminal cleavage/methylation domain-containing protein